MVSFADGSTKDFTSDKRTVYTVRAGASSSLLTLSAPRTVTVVSGAVLGSVSSLAFVDVTFPGTYSVSGTASISVVKFLSLSISTQPYPTPLTAYTGNILTLKLLSCADYWERLQGLAVGTLSDGTAMSAYSFYSVVSWSTSNSAIASLSTLCVSSNCRGLVAASPGTITLTGSFYGISSSLDITISNVRASMVSLSIAATIGTSGTLVGVAGTTATMSMSAYFDDGTSMVISNSGATSTGWVSPASLMSFASSQPASISVSSLGVLTLLNNYVGPVVITATDICGSLVSATLSLYANLAPTTYDVDMGAALGPPFGTVVVGTTFTVPVRIQASSSSSLTAFQVFCYNYYRHYVILTIFLTRRSLWLLTLL